MNPTSLIGPQIGGPIPQLPPKLDPRDGDEKGKIFVGGLSWDTSNASLHKYFSRYGEVIDCVVMKNQLTGKSRGFGFVKFRDSDCVDTVLASVPHLIDGRQVDPKACNPRSQNKGGKSSEKNKHKIFMGGLPTNVTEQQIRDAFGPFGKITDIVIMFDQEKQKSREPAGTGAEASHHSQFKVECKRAEPRDAKAMASMGLTPFTLSAAGLMAANGLTGFPGLPFSTGLPGYQPALSGVPNENGDSKEVFMSKKRSIRPREGVALVPASSLVQGVPGMPLTLAGGVAGVGMPSASSLGLNAANGIGAGMVSSLGGTSLPAWAQASPLQSQDVGETLGMVAVSSTSSLYSANSQAINSSAMTASANGYLGVETQTSQDSRIPQTAYVHAASPGPQSPGESIHSDKAGYILYNGGQASAPLGLFGNYPQEASGYGPTRFFSAQEGKIPTSAIQSPYTMGNFAYAATPSLAPIAGGYSGYPTTFGGLMPLAAYGGEAQTLGIPTRAALSGMSAAQAFHPYRRAEDGR